MWLCESKLKGKITHFRLPSASQKHACLYPFLTLNDAKKEALPAGGGGGGGGGSPVSLVACLHFKRSRVGGLSMFHVAVTVAVGNLMKGCRLSRFHFKCCRYFVGHVACRNLPLQSLKKGQFAIKQKNLLILNL